ncbi:MAG: hypothetical protein KZQ89_08830 [Candidatus Thiodiazotropha sp. (ex Lucinoma kastoroae)]|nr:hypothetical protein [Candidatus Thiodiazotropha sp. (ex Lucinoma kastoroae)]
MENGSVGEEIGAAELHPTGLLLTLSGKSWSLSHYLNQPSQIINASAAAMPLEKIMLPRPVMISEPVINQG